MNDSQHNQQNPPPVNVQQGRTKQTKKPKGRIEPQNPFTDFESNLASYGNLFFPPPPPPKTPSGTRLGLIFLASFAVMGFVIGFLTLNGVLGISQQTSTLATAVAELPSSSAPQIASEPVDLSSLEAQLDEIKQNNADLLARLGEIEILLQSGPQVNSQPQFVATNTPQPPSTPVPEETPVAQTPLGDNEYILKADAGVRLVPNMNEDVIARFPTDTRITLLGGHIDNQNQVWLVFKPTRDMTLQIISTSISEENVYDERPYVFVRDDESSVAVRNNDLVLIPLPLALAVNRMIWHNIEDRANQAQAMKEVTPGELVNVIAVIRNQDGIEWVVVDASTYVDASEFNGIRPVGFIYLRVGDITAFSSDIDMAILSTMPDYIMPIAGGQSAPAPINEPLATATNSKESGTGGGNGIPTSP